MTKCSDSATSTIKNKSVYVSALAANAFLILIAGYLFYNNLAMQKKEVPVFEKKKFIFAIQVIASKKTINPRRSLGRSLFPNCSKCYTKIYKNGSIILNFKKNKKLKYITKITAVKVFAIDNAYNLLTDGRQPISPSSYLVEVSADNNIWYRLGYGYGVTEFRQFDQKKMDIRYVKITALNSPVYLDAIVLAKW